MQRFLCLSLAAGLMASLASGALAQSKEGNRATPGTKSTQGKDAPQAAATGQAGQGGAVTIYQCDNGQRLLATTSGKIALITAGEDSYRLKTAPGAQGTKYAAGPISFVTSKNTATFDQHGTVLKCKKVQ